MNVPLILAGSFLTVLAIMFALIAIVEDIKTAFFAIGFTVAFVIAAGLVAIFWIWVGGGFA